VKLCGNPGQQRYENTAKGRGNGAEGFPLLQLEQPYTLLQVLHSLPCAVGMNRLAPKPSGEVK